MSTVIAPTTTQLYDLVEPYLNAQPTGLAFAIGYATGSGAFDPSLYYAGSVYDQYGNNLNLSQNTLFELGSLSKTFTTTLCTLLGKKYNPKWEKKTIADYASHINVGKQFHPISLLALANYTSGLPEDNVPPVITLPQYLPVPYSPAAMLGYLKGVGTKTWKPTDIGQTYTYSNLAFSTLAQIIPLFHSSTASEDLTELMDDLVFTPLNMPDTAYFGDIFLDQLPVGYNYPGPAAADPGHDVFPAYYGGGGVVSSPSDMLTWLQLNMGILANKTALISAVEQAQTASTSVLRTNNTELGLGWFISIPSGPNLPWVFKDGSLAGYESYMLFVQWVGTGNPSSAGVFVLTNSNGLTSGGVDLTQSIAESVLNIMLGA